MSAEDIRKIITLLENVGDGTSEDDTLDWEPNVVSTGKYLGFDYEIIQVIMPGSKTRFYPKVLGLKGGIKDPTLVSRTTDSIEDAHALAKKIIDTHMEDNPFYYPPK